MNEEMYNYIGIAIMAVAFWYLHIYRPKQLMKNPGELQIMPLLSATDKKLFRAVKECSGNGLQVLDCVSLATIVYSKKLGEKKYFKDAIKKLIVAHLIVDQDFNPVLAVVYSSPDEETKLNYLALAGIGCCVFQRDTEYDAIVQQLKAALDEIQNDIKPVSEASEDPALA